MQYLHSDTDKVVYEATSCFVPLSDVNHISILKGGNIHNTYIIFLTKASKHKPIVLQRINTEVFDKPSNIIYNIRQLESFILNNNISMSLRDSVSLTLPKLVPTLADNNKYLLRNDSGYWKAMTFIDNSYSLSSISNSIQITNLSRALSVFHKTFNAFEPDNLKNSINGFHDILYYLRMFDTYRNSYFRRYSPLTSVKTLLFTINRYRQKVLHISNSLKSSRLTYSLIHGDPKYSNFLFDKNSHNVRSIVDLDTLMYGPILLDISDFIRSNCNNVHEDTLQTAESELNIDLFKTAIQAYYSENNDLLNSHDWSLLPDVIFLVSFELAIRFITDYFSGNKYFQIDHPSRNITRAQVQINFCNSIVDQQLALRQYIQDFI